MEKPINPKDVPTNITLNPNRLAEASVMGMFSLFPGVSNEEILGYASAVAIHMLSMTLASCHIGGDPTDIVKSVEHLLIKGVKAYQQTIGEGLEGRRRAKEN